MADFTNSLRETPTAGVSLYISARFVRFLCFTAHQPSHFIPATCGILDGAASELVRGFDFIRPGE